MRPKNSSSGGVYTQDLTGWKGVVSPCAKKSRESVVAETQAFFRNRQREFSFDHALQSSHQRSFLEGIELQEPWMGEMGGQHNYTLCVTWKTDTHQAISDRF